MIDICGDELDKSDGLFTSYHHQSNLRTRLEDDYFERRKRELRGDD